jgi:hypothetical protein
LEIKQQYIKVIEQGTGKESVLIREIKPFKNHGKRFVKIYVDCFKILPYLNYYELQIFIYIITNLKMKSKTIALKPELFNFHRQTFYKSINGLIVWDFINKSPVQKGMYLINTDFYFNGQI